MSIEEIYRHFLSSNGVSIDSRTILENQLFFALRGSRVASHTFAMDAIGKGARLAIVDSGYSNDTDNIIVVNSTLETLQKLAAHHRDHLSIPLIGITGSVGKTTTKELIHSVLSTQYKTYCTQGNLNNHIGVPLSILAIPLEMELAIIEMGANHIGEIESLCEIARPTHGLITRIGKAHLEGFGSLEGVIIAKSELYRFLQKNKGTAFINENDELLLAVSAGFEMEKIYIHANLMTKLIESDPFLSIKVKRREESWSIINTRIPGNYNLPNIEAAICIGDYFKIPMDKIRLGIESFESNSNRSQWVNYQGNSFLLDAYNANPVSMEASIKSFADITTTQKKVLILGEMRELGMDSAKEHQHILDLINEYTWNQVILVGPLFSALTAIPGYLYFNEIAALTAWFENQKFTDTLFLIKGSRGVALEKLFNKPVVNPGSSH